MGREIEKAAERARMLSNLASFVQEHKRTPIMDEVVNEGIATRKKIETYFRRLQGFFDSGKEAYPSIFAEIFCSDDFTEEKFLELKRDVKRYKRFVITTAVVGAKVNRPFLKALKTYCEKRKAKLLVIPTGHDLTKLDPVLKGEGLVLRELRLNSNIKIDPMLLNPKVLRPLSGLGRIGERSISTIYGAPKLTKESLATDVGRFPHWIFTTGAITNPAYKDLSMHLHKKTDVVATHDHDLACIVVEVADDQFFFQREMQADLDGSVVDLTVMGPVRYRGDGSTKSERALNFNVPDWHHGETAEDCYQIWPKLASVSRAKTVSLHDVTSSLGHTHHTVTDRIKSAQIEESGFADPAFEIQGFADDMKMWLKACKAEFYIVGSNHPEHLNRSVAEGTLDRPGTYRTYLELALAMLDGADPLQWGLKNYAGFSSSRVNFLSRETRHVLKNKFGEMALHFHGDKGNDGAKNSGQSSGIAISAGCAIINHLHSPKIIAGNTDGGKGNGGVWVGGTSTCVEGDERPGYARGGGGSSWLKTATFVYGSETGRFLRQQVTIVGGQWCLDSGTPKETKDIRAKRHQKLAALARGRRQRGFRKIS
jgi:hypothetical protein